MSWCLTLCEREGLLARAATGRADPVADLTGARLAGSLAVSASTLNRAYARWVGISPKVPITIVPGQQYVLAMEATGTSPTTIRAKFWRLGQAEPDWMRTGTNSLAALQAPGAVSVFTYVPGNPNGGGVAFDSIRVVDPAAGG